MAHAAQQQTSAAAPKPIYRVHEATQPLAVSVATIYRMCDRGELVKGKIGTTRSVGITAASVNAMLARMVPAEDAPEASTHQMGS